MIKAIETIYNGYRFRSRLEARWAVFFDTLGVRYRYEVEGYELAPGLRYLPDFLLDTGAAMSELGTDECWVEIKGKEPDALEERKAGLLAEQTDKPVFIFIRDVAAPSHDNYAYGYFPWGRGTRHHMQFAWTECLKCGLCEIAGEGRTLYLTCSCTTGVQTLADGTVEIGRSIAGPRLTAAFLAARQSRFEHGESGPPRRK